MFEWIRRNTDRRRNLREIAALDERDLADIGLGREALEHLVVTNPGVYEQMDRMGALHGLTHSDLQNDRAEFAALVAVCEDCAAKSRCQGALGRAETSVADVGFCPNHGAYAGMVRA